MKRLTNKELLAAAKRRRERHKEYMRTYQRKRYESDDVYRERCLNRAYLTYAMDPEWARAVRRKSAKKTRTPTSQTVES